MTDGMETFRVDWLTMIQPIEKVQTDVARVIEILIAHSRQNKASKYMSF